MPRSRKVRRPKLRACIYCGTKEGITGLVDAATEQRGFIFFVDDHLIGYWKCADKFDCDRRERMNMGPLPRVPFRPEIG